MTSAPAVGRAPPDGAAGRWRMLLPIAVAALGAGFAWIAGSAYLRGAEARIARQYAEQHRTREVVVAARRLAAGVVVEPAMLARRKVPVRFAPSSAFGPERLAELLGRELSQPLDAGDVLVPGALRAVTPALSAHLSTGQRALTIAVDDTNSHAGLLRPGDIVDLLFLSADESGATPSARIRPLLQAVRVLATGSALGRDSPERGDGDTRARDFATLTLQVTARDAERIALAERTGELLVSLRGPGDLGSTGDGPLDLRALLADDSARSSRRKSVAGWHVDGWIGGHEGRLVPHRWQALASPGGASP